MSPLPKLKIILPSGKQGEHICELDQAKDSLNFNEGIFTVEGQGVHSYDELVHLASQDKYKNMEFIEVKLLRVIDGG